ncbi:MAG: Uma2 family endonuclease [Selenomonadaceae bacterium]|nr:Uma2 family endonuclease [Selenomonadaceae bacterium]
MLNDAIYYKSYETIGGEKFMAAAAANPLHGRLLFKLARVLDDYTFDHKNGYVFTDNVDVYLPDGNLFRPDLTVVTKETAGIINWKKAIFGVPDMVVEVLSPSTRVRDLTVKKDAYESNGVKEYWIVDPYMKSVDVYILQDGKYKLDGSYTKFSDYDWKNLSDEEKAAAKFEIKVSIFDDLVVKIDDIFSWDYDD